MINLALLKSDEKFSNVIKKIFLNQVLDDVELSYCLSCAILFLKKYEKDKREKRCLTFAYFIILKVALINKYYVPLYDVSVNMGWYPISRFITNKNLIESLNLDQVVVDSKIDNFELDGIVETYKQRNNRKEILKSESLEKAYIAPTSYGKSKLIQDFLRLGEFKRIGVIVPTKSLLTQTYKNIRKEFSDKKIIFHDEMYNGEENFIAIFTQERALRLLSNNKKLSFDFLVIDEAHNLLDKDPRSILLLRLIRRNYSRNNLNKILYLSPLVESISNLKFEEKQEIFEKRIDFNIKEPSINLFDIDIFHYKYNRFFNNYYNLSNNEVYLEYMLSNKKLKNFFYLKKPKSVEQLSLTLSECLNYIDSDELNVISETLSKNIHKDFYCVDYVKKGILYLHGKLPDIIKEYLEYKFKTIESISFLISNSVILEGVNLPIDNLFILNTHGLDTKKMINLIGRVNRLSEVFDLNNNDLDKLSPDVHFVYSEKFTGESSNLRNSIKKIKSGLFKDKVKNPVLLNYELENSTTNNNSGDSNSEFEEISNFNDIKKREDFLFLNDLSSEFNFKCSLIESNIDTIYTNFENAYTILEERLFYYKNNENWLTISVVDKIGKFFIEGMDDHVVNKNILRLSKDKAKNFYTVFNENKHKLNIRENIKVLLKYFYSIMDNYAGKNFYVGASYGEFSSENSFHKTYIDLSTKNEKELVNIALIKIKIESDFLSFVLYRFANVLYESELLTEQEYNLFIYGTSSRKSNEFIKLGLSSNIVNSLEANGQLVNLGISESGSIIANENFNNFLSEQDDLFKFEILKFIH